MYYMPFLCCLKVEKKLSGGGGIQFIPSLGRWIGSAYLASSQQGVAMGCFGMMPVNLKNEPYIRRAILITGRFPK